MNISVKNKIRWLHEGLSLVVDFKDVQMFFCLLFIFYVLSFIHINRRNTIDMIRRKYGT